MFGQDEDDSDFLSPTGGAKLASLFGIDQTGSTQGNESFQYTAPKQPKKPGSAGAKSPKPTGTSPAGPVPSVLFATAVHAYKYVNGQYAKQGKFGAAVLGNHTSKEYRILLYISQQQPVTSARLHPGFVFTVQLNNYAAFYDDQRQSWSVLFESETSAMDFSKQVCIARCNSAPLDAVLSQDLTPGEGQAAEIGDLLEVAYTGWLFQNHVTGQMFDSNVQKDKLLRVKLGSGKVIKGWEEGMLGMKKGGKRFLAIPPTLAYGSQGLSGRIPPNATLLFEVEVKRMKQKDAGTDRQSVGSRESPVSITESIPAETLPQPPTSVPPKPGEPAVRAKSNSISEQLANPDMAKAKLISRMAKMGQPMLPFLTGSSTPQPDSSDSEIEDPRISPHPAAPLLVRPTPQINQTPAHISAPVPQQQPVSGLPSSSAALLPVGPIASQALPPGQAHGFQPYTGIQYTYSQNPTTGTQLQPFGHVYPTAVQQQAPYQGDVTSFLMTEARQQNTEIRLAIGKVVDKIDNLASKVDGLQKQSSAGPSHLLPGISSITMESAMIMNNIQRIIQENERLKQEVLDKSSRIEEQNAKIGELLNRNQRYVEQSNMLMEQRNDSLKTSTENTQAKLLHAMQEKHALHIDEGTYQAKVAEELAAATGHLSRLQLEVTAYQKREMEQRTQLVAAQQEAEKCQAELFSLRAQLIDLKETSELTKNQAKTEKEIRRSLELQLAGLEEEISDLKVEKQNLEKSLAERKRKSQQERQRAEEEQEELRKTFHEEAENLRQLLKKAQRQAAAGQLSSSSSRDRDEQRLAELQEQGTQLHPLKEKCAQLQSQVTSLNDKLRESRVRENDNNLAKEQVEEKLSQLQEKLSQLHPLRQQCAQLQAQVAILTEQLRDEQTRDGDRQLAKDPTEEVKKIMNGVFQSLRKEFVLEESYSGRVVLGTIMNTIKVTTLQLLSNPQNEEAVAASSSGEEDEEDESAVNEVVDQSALKAEQTLNQDQIQTGYKENETLTTAPVTGVIEEKLEKDDEAKKTVGNQQTGPPSMELQEVSEDIPVRVIQEDLDAPSALVHMISSDMPESSTVTDSAQGDVTLAENNVLEKPPSSSNAELHTLVNENLTESEELQLSNDTMTREVPPPLVCDNDSSSPVPPKEETSTLGSTVTQSQAKPEERTDQGLHESDNEDLFKETSPKQKAKQEEEEEEEVSLKGRPPPSPLFGDEDDEEDDLDWLG